jgi:branched-chain amino acid transport system ATP-binding protein
MLSVENLDVFYDDVQALDSVSLDIEQGAIVAIVGANGAGKTTLIRALAGMLPQARGRVVFNGADISRWPSHRVCDLGLGQVAEGRQVFPTLSVAENLDIGAMVPRARARRAGNRERVLAMFPKLAERLRQPAGTLSGGEQQMLAIARALMMEPRLLVLDEPSFGLAPRIVEDIFAIVERIRKEEKVSVLLVEQNASLALELADHAYLLETGYVVASGSAKSLADDPQIRRSYLGY